MTSSDTASWLIATADDRQLLIGRRIDPVQLMTGTSWAMRKIRRADSLPAFEVGGDRLLAPRR